MRDATLSEKTLINKGVCPCCKSHTWLAGPRGGLCINIECAQCGLRANVVQLPTGIDALQVIVGPSNYVPLPEPMTRKTTILQQARKFVATLMGL